MLSVALITTLFFATPVSAEPNTNHTVNFQGRLLRSTGGIVPDGHYNMQFKLYEGGSGSEANNPDGNLVWSESYVNNSTNGGIRVKNGYFSVNLGANNPFGSNVNWNNDTIWLSMNIAGSHASCTTFGTAPCDSDGEMLPMKRLTATPYSLNSGAVGGKTVNELVQLGQGMQTDGSGNSSIAINNTGSSHLMHLQSSGTDVFTLNNTGSITLGSVTDQTISVAESVTGDGMSLTLAAGAAATGSDMNGGDLLLQGGQGDGSGVNGNVIVSSGDRNSIGAFQVQYNDGQVLLNADTVNSTVSIGNVDITSDLSVDTDSIHTDRNLSISSEGEMTVGSTENPLNLHGGSVNINANNGGSVSIQGGTASAGDMNGGSLMLSGGAGSGAGARGLVVIDTPTFSTTTDDDNCFTNGALVDTNCTVSVSTVDNSGAAVIGFSTADQSATLPNPTIKTPGRIFYVMAAPESEDFTLLINSGATEIAMSANSATNLIWNGSAWASASSSSLGGLQGGLYSPQSTGETESIDISSDNDEPVVLDIESADTSEEPTMTTGDTPLSIDGSPDLSTDDSPIGSMYYDDSIGKVQCLEAEGWGNCGDRPDTFVTISPEYSGAVMNGADIGTITSDLCSDSLNINNGTDGQPNICDENETYNFYNWTSPEEETQTRSIFVNYQLPSDFEAFVEGSTSIVGKVDGDNASVGYQIYRDNKDGLSPCGLEVKISDDGDTSWQKSTAKDDTDPANCDFEAGNSVLFRINLAASKDANAYVSNLNFVFSSN